ncbi:MAG: carbamate kinase [Candidatus Methylomirabilales bacterium]
MNPTDVRSSRLLIAVGGNAIHPGGIIGTPEQQVAIVAETATALLPLMLLDNELVITHGNGPVVGKILLRQALARQRVVPMSLDICVAHSQGGIAYLLMQAFENALREAGSQRHVVCLLTQVEVDPQDPAFSNPTKPIGYFYTEEEARALTRELGWRMREDAGRGWRLVVPSPEPRHIVDISLIDALAKRGAVVIAGGGGGIPVIRGPKKVRHGVEAVIDKDHTSALMANVLGIEQMMILTGVSQVAIHFGRPKQRAVGRLTLSEARRYLAEGHFPSGSMGPKVEAAIRFLEGGGKRAIIAHLKEALPALRGETGTHVVPDGD